MTKLNVTQAAKAAGLTRQTLYRKMESGKLSFTKEADGERSIDVAELSRMVGRVIEPDTEPSNVTSPTAYKGTDTTSADLVAELRRQVLEAKEREYRAAERERRALEAAAERERFLQAQIEQTQRLLQQLSLPSGNEKSAQPGHPAVGRSSSWWKFWK